jgi:hypothetical protein
MVQVTDSTGAAVNSTAVSVTVNSATISGPSTLTSTTQVEYSLGAVGAQVLSTGSFQAFVSVQTTLAGTALGGTASGTLSGTGQAIGSKLKDVLEKLRHVFRIKKGPPSHAKAPSKAPPPTGGVSVPVPTGINITVYPHPSVLLTFGQVTKAGSATATPLTRYPPLPQGGSFLSGTVFDIKTSAAFTGKPTVGIRFDGSGLTDAQKLALKMFRIHSAKGSVWEDVTSRIDVKNNIVYGATDHFSIFGVR